MARSEIERNVSQSLLDRLTDLSPDVPADPPASRFASTQAFRDGVTRDLEWLLNTRRTMVPAPAHCQELRRSAYEYGLPDTTGVAPSTRAGREAVLEILQDVLSRFEPRLGEVRVRLAEGQAVAQLRFTVEALLRMDPEPERVLFDTVLDVSRGEYEVEGAGGRGD